MGQYSSPAGISCPHTEHLIGPTEGAAVCAATEAAPCLCPSLPPSSSASRNWDNTHRRGPPSGGTWAFLFSFCGGTLGHVPYRSSIGLSEFRLYWQLGYSILSSSARHNSGYGTPRQQRSPLSPLPLLPCRNYSIITYVIPLYKCCIRPSANNR